MSLGEGAATPGWDVRQVSPIRAEAGTTVLTMRRLCMRPACAGRAAVLVVVDTQELTFTIRDLGELDGPGWMVLCDTHFDRMRAPGGWTLVDERTGGRLLKFPNRTAESPVRRQPAAPRRRETVTPFRELARRAAAPAETTVPAGSGGSTEVVRSIRAATHPLGTARPEAPDVPDPTRMPLLARAFLGVDRHPATSRGGPVAQGGESDVDLSADVSADGGYGEDWDQRDHLDEYADEHLPLGEPEPEPVA